MMSLAIKSGVRVVMESHVYKFNGKTYQQSQGGAIGLELTGAVARVYMIWWDKMLKQQLKEFAFRMGIVSISKICR